MDPLTIELELDGIQADTRAEKRRVGWRAVGNLVQGYGAMWKQLKTIGQPPPDWLEPPLHACFGTSWTVGEWITVQTDSVSAPVLERALAGAVHGPLYDDQVRFEAWLTWDSDPPVEESLIAVRVGTDVAGTLDPEQTEQYRTDMVNAAALGQLPAVAARLTRVGDPPRYRLELAAPSPGPTTLLREGEHNDRGPDELVKARPSSATSLSA